MGKSNTIKVILETMLSTVDNLGQIVFDLSGGIPTRIRRRERASTFAISDSAADTVSNHDTPKLKELPEHPNHLF